MADSQYDESVYRAIHLFFTLLTFYSVGCQSMSVTAEELILEKIERTYNVQAGGNLTVASEFGAIEIQTAEQNEIEIVVTKAAKSWHRSAKEALADFEVAFSPENAQVPTPGQTDDAPDYLSVVPENVDVHIEGKFKHGREHWRKIRNRLEIRFHVTIPKDYNVDLETQGGSIKVGDLDGTVRAHTSGGSLRLGNITSTVWGRTSGGSIKLTSCGSPVDLKTSGGSIEVVDVAGDVQAQTSGGSLRFGDITGSIWGKTSGGSIKVASCSGGADVQTSGGGIRLQSVGGDVNAKTSGGNIHAVMKTQLQDACSLRTSGGGITVTLIPDIAIDVDAETHGGHVSTDFAVASVIQGKVPKNKLKGNINGGGPLLKLHTSGGNIHLQKAAD
ncbi:DUF4097 domain-containing protein [Candidatus Poribacteria bacterium]|nr:DUF4097 domain-containing protein [Candidatus Poribacteria bacterium]